MLTTGVGLLLAVVLSGQDTGSIRGRVVDAETGAPLADVLVVTRDPDRRTTSSAEGWFEVTDLPPGARTLLVSLVGYGLARPDVVVTAGSTTDVAVPLAPGASTYTEQVTVAASSDTVRSASPVEFRMRSAELQELRGVLADDPFRAIQAMPGVATGDDFRAEFSVRGSEFRQMGFAVDGVPAPWLVHGPRAVNDTGTVAMVNADVLAEIGLTSGASPQPYGNRTGAWVQSTMREGSRDAFRASGSLSGTGASTVIEGPIGRSRKGAWLASVRKSYIDWLISRLDFEESSRFGFSDAQSKIVVDVSPRHQLQLSAVAGRSRYTEVDESPSANGVSTAGASTAFVVGAWRTTLGTSMVATQRLTWATVRYRNRGDFAQDLTRGTEWTVGYRAEVSAVLRPWLTVDGGASADRDDAHLQLWQYSGIRALVPVLRATARWRYDRWRGGVFGRARVSPRPSLMVDVGTRGDRESLDDRRSASPWLLARWTASPRWSFAAGAGVVWQLPELAMLSPPLVLAARPGLERARHGDVTAELILSPTLRAQATVFDRQEESTLRVDAVLPRLIAGVLRVPPATGAWQNAVDVSARGVEIFLRRSASSGVVGWISYGYGRTRVADRVTGEQYWGDFDQRHQVNLFVSSRIGTRTTIGAKFRYGSNMPIPAYVTGPTEALRASEARNVARLPAYGRLDLRANRTFHWSARRLTLFAEVINALGRQNLGRTGGGFRADGSVTGFTETLLPFLPSAGIRVEF